MIRSRQKAPLERTEREALEWFKRIHADATDKYRAAFEDWYAAESRHADAYDDVLRTWDETARIAQTPVGQGRRPFFASVSRTDSWRYARLALVGALLLAMIGVGAHQFGGSGLPLIPAAYASSVGQIQTLRLPDGTRLTLDTDSAIRLAFSESERRVILERGRARFEVEPGGHRAFVVAAGPTIVTATGTTFDVDLSRGDVVVSPLRGVLQVGSSTAAAPSQPVLLMAGQMASVSNNVLRRGRIAASDTQWPSGMLTFENAPVADVLARANRYAAARIVLADDEGLGTLRFTGTFQATDTATLAKLLATTFKLVLTKNAENRWRLSRA